MISSRFKLRTTLLKWLLGSTPPFGNRSVDFRAKTPTFEFKLPATVVERPDVPVYGPIVRPAKFAERPLQRGPGRHPCRQFLDFAMRPLYGSDAPTAAVPAAHNEQDDEKYEACDTKRPAYTLAGLRPGPWRLDATHRLTTALLGTHQGPIVRALPSPVTVP